MSKNSQCSSEDQGPASVTTLLIFQVVNARRQRANVGSLWPVLKTTGSCRAESNLQCAPICQRLLSVADLLVKTSSSSEKPRWLCLPVKLRTGGGAPWKKCWGFEAMANRGLGPLPELLGGPRPPYMAPPIAPPTHETV